MVIDAFGGALGAQQSICARDICVTVRASSGAVFGRISSGNYRNTVSADKTEANIFFTNLLQGESRDILVAMDIPAVSAPTDCFQLMEPSVTYRTLDMSSAAEPLRVQGDMSTIGRLSVDQLDPAIKRSLAVDVQDQSSAVYGYHSPSASSC